MVLGEALVLGLRASSLPAGIKELTSPFLGGAELEELGRLAVGAVKSDAWRCELGTRCSKTESRRKRGLSLTKVNEPRKAERCSAAVSFYTAVDDSSSGNIAVLGQPTAPKWNTDSELMTSFPELFHHLTSENFLYKFNKALTDEERNSSLFCDPLPETSVYEETSQSVATADDETSDAVGNVVVKRGLSARERRLKLRRQRNEYANQDPKEAEMLTIQQTADQAVETTPSRREPHLDGLSSFMLEAGRARLLTREEEVFLSSKLQLGYSLKGVRDKMEQRLGREPTLSEWANELEMSTGQMRKHLRNAELAKEKLVKSNLRLVLSVAKKYSRIGVDMADLIMAGVGGLVKGIEKFDPNRGFKLSTYVHWWIRQAVNRAISDSGTIRLPVHMCETLSRIKKAKGIMMAEGVTPDVDNLSKALKIPKRKIANALQVNISIKSLDEDPLNSNQNFTEGISYHNMVPDQRPEAQPWTQLEKDLFQKNVHDLIEKELNPRQKEIVRLHYGIGRKDGLMMTREFIGLNKLGVSRERVRQMEMVAMRKLQVACIENQFDLYCH